MTRADWLAERRRGIGSSDVAAILGVSPWASAVDVYLDKIGQTKDAEPSRAMQAGTALEALALKWAAEELDRPVTRHPQSESLQHADLPMLRCTPDGWCDGDDGNIWIVEAKATRDDPWTKGPPLHYLVQVQHQLLVTGAPGAYVAQVSRRNLECTIHRVPRHDGLIAKLERELPLWWQTHVVAGVPPAPTTRADVVKLHPRPITAAVRLGDDAEALVLERDKISAQIEALDKRKREITDALAAAVGAAELGVLPGGRAVKLAAKAASTYTVNRKATRELRVLKRVPKTLDESAIPDSITPIASKVEA